MNIDLVLDEDPATGRQRLHVDVSGSTVTLEFDRLAPLIAEAQFEELRVAAIDFAVAVARGRPAGVLVIPEALREQAEPVEFMAGLVKAMPSPLRDDPLLPIVIYEPTDDHRPR